MTQLYEEIGEGFQDFVSQDEFSAIMHGSEKKESSMGSNDFGSDFDQNAVFRDFENQFKTIQNFSRTSIGASSFPRSSQRSSIAQKSKSVDLKSYFNSVKDLSSLNTSKLHQILVGSKNRAKTPMTGSKKAKTPLENVLRHLDLN
jgi:hypothetical protein